MKTALLNMDCSSGLPLEKVLDAFFSTNPPDRVKFLFWKLFQCYVLKDCVIKAEVPEKDVALFYDQLTDLVTAVYLLHMKNNNDSQSKEGRTNA